MVASSRTRSNGAGGRAYRRSIGDIHSHVAAIEMDGGAEKPVGFVVTTYAGDSDRTLGILQQIGKLLDGIGAGRITKGGGGSDIQPLMADGVPNTTLSGITRAPTHWTKLIRPSVITYFRDQLIAASLKLVAWIDQRASRLL